MLIMPSPRDRAYARYVLAATQLLGSMVAVERKQRRMTAQEVAERLGISRNTLRRIEAGDPKVEIGLAFEACALMNIRLFEGDLGTISARLDEHGKRLALLPRYARPHRLKVDDDF